jgi:hypothetical protein
MLVMPVPVMDELNPFPAVDTVPPPPPAITKYSTESVGAEACSVKKLLRAANIMVCTLE